MVRKRYDSTKQWYAVHTYSGYEDKVSESVRQRINAVDMADKIFDVMVPKEKQIEIKNGKRKVVDRKIFQGYVLVEMKLTEEHGTSYATRLASPVSSVAAQTRLLCLNLKSRKSKSAWASKSQSTKSTSQKAKWSRSSTVRSRASMAPSAKSTPKRASSRSWSACLAAILLSSSTHSRSKKSSLRL